MNDTDVSGQLEVCRLYTRSIAFVDAREIFAISAIQEGTRLHFNNGQTWDVTGSIEERRRSVRIAQLEASAAKNTCVFDR